MRPKERRESGEQDLFRARLDQIIDLEHALVKLAQVIDWRFLEEKFGAIYTDKPGDPPLPTRLMAGLAILKHSYDLSDEGLCERWVENPYFQYFCGEEFFDRSSLTRWRQRMGEEKLQALLQESLAVATRTEAMKPSDLARIVVDTTVQPKAVMFPSDAKLLNRARERLVRLAKKLGVELRQSYRRVGKFALIKHSQGVGRLGEAAEVVSGGGEHGIDGVAAGMGEIVAAHAVVFLEVADHGLDGGPSFELALDLRGEAALLAGGVDLEPVIGRRVVAAIAGIGDAAIEHVADERFHLRNDRGERVSVIGIAR